MGIIQQFTLIYRPHNSLLLKMFSLARSHIYFLFLNSITHPFWSLNVWIFSFEGQTAVERHHQSTLNDPGNVLSPKA